MPTLQELEVPIEKRIASALIEATPETWKRALLDVRAEDDAGVFRMPHTISSPEGRREVVTPTTDIISATFELHELFKSHGRAWRSLSFQITEKAEGWSYAADYKY